MEKSFPILFLSSHPHLVPIEGDHHHHGLPSLPLVFIIRWLTSGDKLGWFSLSWNKTNIPRYLETRNHLRPKNFFSGRVCRLEMTPKRSSFSYPWSHLPKSRERGENRAIYCTHIFPWLQHGGRRLPAEIASERATMNSWHVTLRYFPLSPARAWMVERLFWRALIDNSHTLSLSFSNRKKVGAPQCVVSHRRSNDSHVTLWAFRIRRKVSFSPPPRLNLLRKLIENGLRQLQITIDRVRRKETGIIIYVLLIRLFFGARRREEIWERKCYWRELIIAIPIDWPRLCAYSNNISSYACRRGLIPRKFLFLPHNRG